VDNYLSSNQNLHTVSLFFLGIGTRFNVCQTTFLFFLTSTSERIKELLQLKGAMGLHMY
jgi:hypothetical protein